MRARAAVDGTWEQYELWYNSGYAAYALKSKANGKWVSVEVGWTGNDYATLRARGDTIGQWERFKLYTVTSEVVSSC